ncbi:hypothetical protein [Paraburkholderia sp. J10-1]|uniref:hypothetical protein n=1 Tax=Paraburkholderia sp. J10-1 TaxID=2805430 RepID=UPI002AB643E4|nr:hypothetical protein [Paraburkholderia sp. J10-1]
MKALVYSGPGKFAVETRPMPALQGPAMAEAGMIDPDDLALFRFCESAEEVWSAIRNWYGEED